MKLLITAAALFGTLTAASAQTPESLSVFGTGEALTKNCRAYMSLVRNQMNGTGQLNLDAGQCYGYVVAVVDTLAFEGPRQGSPFPRICIPTSVNGNVVAEIVAKFADQNPQEQTNAANVIVRKALGASYPCR